VSHGLGEVRHRRRPAGCRRDYGPRFLRILGRRVPAVRVINPATTVNSSLAGRSLSIPAPTTRPGDRRPAAARYPEQHHPDRCRPRPRRPCVRRCRRLLAHPANRHRINCRRSSRTSPRRGCGTNRCPDRAGSRRVRLRNPGVSSVMLHRTDLGRRCPRARHPGRERVSRRRRHADRGPGSRGPVARRSTVVARGARRRRGSSRVARRSRSRDSDPVARRSRGSAPVAGRRSRESVRRVDLPRGRHVSGDSGRRDRQPARHRWGRRAIARRPRWMRP
jgi:hypothetical protein